MARNLRSRGGARLAHKSFEFLISNFEFFYSALYPVILNFFRNASTTGPGTNASTGPPRRAISLTMREER
jgi:hypothetical protein